MELFLCGMNRNGWRDGNREIGRLLDHLEVKSIKQAVVVSSKNPSNRGCVCAYFNEDPWVARENPLSTVADGQFGAFHIDLEHLREREKGRQLVQGHSRYLLALSTPTRNCRACAFKVICCT